MGFSHSFSGERDLLGLAPGGVYLATPITQGTGELLPHLFTLIPPEAGRYLFCGTFLTPPCKIGEAVISRDGTVRITDHPALRSSDFPPLSHPAKWML